MTTREDLHRLIDALPECDLHMAEMLIEWRHHLREDPMLVTLATAPLDDEPTTPEEDAAADQAWQEYLAGNYITLEQAKRELLD